jgi:large subunit ribosomal protein L35
MPKMKTSSAAKKRFRVTPTGKVMVQRRGLRHNLEHKSGKTKRALGRVTATSAAVHRTALRMLGKR